MLQSDTITTWPRHQDRTRCEPGSLPSTAPEPTSELEEPAGDLARWRRTSPDASFARTGYTSRDLPGLRGAGGLIPW